MILNLDFDMNRSPPYYSKMFRLVSAIALFILVFMPSLWAHDQVDQFAAHVTTLNPPVTLPDFVFQSDGGKELRLADFRGHPLVLNLWASWCGPCVAEMPSLDTLQARLGSSNLNVIALDEERNGTDIVKVFFKRHDIYHLLIYTDPSGHSATSALRAGGMPTTFLINADGKAIGRVDGSADWAAPDTEAFLRKNLLGS